MTEVQTEALPTRNPIKWLKSFFTKQSSSFTYLNVTQFLGALNDNVFKFLIAYFLISLEGIGSSPRILAISGAIFVIPFLLFSSMSGTLADRLSKRNIIVFTKILEFIIMSGGVLAFIYESQLWSLTVLFLMATQSAVFGPSKYGIIPELVSTEKLSKANGLLTMFTFLAIIIGTFLPSFLLDHTGRNYLVGAGLCVVLALVGLITSFCIEETPRGTSSKKVNPRIIYEVYKNLKIARDQPSLLIAIIASAYLFFCAAFFQLNMIPFAVQSLGLTDIQGGYLFCLTALGIGFGSVIAGKICGSDVELALVPLAGLGVIAGCFMVDYFSGNLVMILPVVMLLGVFGGIWVIPLDSYIQMASPPGHTGQMVASANFLSFVGVLVACGTLYLLNDILGLSPDKAFSIIGWTTAVAVSIVGYRFFDYLTRFIGMILSRLRFQLTFSGRENIPNEPAVYVCHHTAWNDTLVMLGSQRRRMRFFIENEQESPRMLRRLYRMMRVVMIPPIETLESNTNFLQMLKKQLKKGISVCVFVEDARVQDEILRLSETLGEMVNEVDSPILPVFIDKGEKLKQARWLRNLREIYRCPVLVTFGPPTSLSNL